MEFNSLLIPVDFSRTSEAAFDRAVDLVGGDNPVVILIHVIDPALVEFALDHGFGARAQIVQMMRHRAERMMDAYQKRAQTGVEVKKLVSEGVPFLEIIKKAEDLLVDAIVMTKLGASGALEHLLFGSTAERVIRGSRRPVIVLPVDDS